MFKVGLTGNIGSGKTIVLKIFQTFGISTYNFDSEAKNLYKHEGIINLIKKEFGNSVITNGEVNKKIIASIVFNNKAELVKLNSIIHPYVMRDFDDWCDFKKYEKYIIAESAIIFESNIQKHFDFIINVEAPTEIAIDRIIKRDHCKMEDVENRMNNQFESSEKNKLCDFNIINNEKQSVILQVLKIHNTLLSPKKYN